RALLQPDLTLAKLIAQPPAPGASAVAAVSPQAQSAIVEASGLPPLPEGKMYELWWITSLRGPIPAGLFTVQPGKTATVVASMPPADDHLLASAITLEAAGGAGKPTGEMYLKGAFSISRPATSLRGSGSESEGEDQ